MNICILGSTGRVGSLILANSLQAGHTVHALVRNSEKAPPQAPNLKIFIGDAMDESSLTEVMNGTDVVISALNTDGASVLSSSAPIIIRAMEQLGINRIITIGTAGILQSRTEPELYRFQSKESRRTSTKDAEDHLSMYQQLRASNLEWTIVCPTYLPIGERTGIYRVEREVLPLDGSSISTFDTADFTFLQVASKEYLHCRVGLAY